MASEGGEGRKSHWKDTNTSVSDSVIEQRCKEAAETGGPQWEGAGKSPGLQIWRIEKFRAVPWPKTKYGIFHIGDSYIVLNTYTARGGSKLKWDIHFWIGNESTEDEYVSAAIKANELDELLCGEPAQHREAEHAESELFLSYFSSAKLRYLEGGVESGFDTVTDEPTREAQLFQVKGQAGNVRLKQVKLSRESMNSGDVFILDTEKVVYQWNGEESNVHERAKAAEMCSLMSSERPGVRIEVLQQGVDDDEAQSFWTHIPGEKKLLGIKLGEVKVKAANAGGDDEANAAFTPVLVRLQVIGTKGRVTDVASGEHPPISHLKTDGVYLLDNGSRAWLWVGKEASPTEKKSAFTFAQTYLKANKRPSVLPLTRVAEGKETEEFTQSFGPVREEQSKAKGACNCALM